MDERRKDRMDKRRDILEESESEGGRRAGTPKV
jgi:hypothetical protein